MDDNRIFIGKIPQSVTEAEIRTHFAQFGEIEHVQCPNSTKAFKIAFVTYTDATGRDQALAFTAHSLQNSPLNVVKATPKPQRAPDGSGGLFGQQQEARVFVGHIPEEVSEEMLQAYFSKFGTLLKCFKPATGSRSVRSTNPPGYAFVTFSSHKEKHLCLAQEEHNVNGHSLRVMEAKPKPVPGGGGAFGGAQYGAPATGFGGFGGAPAYNPYGMPTSGGGGGGFSQRHGQEETNPRRVFISHMQPSVQDADLRTHFSQFGVITDVFIPQPQPADNSAEDPKGFAYISYDDSQSVYRALALKEHIVHGKRIDVQEARPKSSRSQAPPPRRGQEARVFIGKIPKHITDENISAHFAQFGEVKEFYRPRDQNARDGMAFGFLTYTSINELARCLAVLEHVLSDGTVLSVTRARPRPGPRGEAGGAAGGDMGFSGGQQMPVFGQQAFAAPQAYNPYGQQQFSAAQPQFAAAAGQQQFAAAPVQTQQFAAMGTQQQFAAQGQQFGATTQQQFAAMNQAGYGGQLQQQAMPQVMQQGYGATQQPRTSQRYNPY